MKKNYLKSLQNGCFRIVIAKSVSITSIFNERSLFNNLIHQSLSSIFNLIHQSLSSIFKCL